MKKVEVFKFWVEPKVITKGSGNFHYFVKRSEYLKAQRKIAELEARIASLETSHTEVDCSELEYDPEDPFGRNCVVECPW